MSCNKEALIRLEKKNVNPVAQTYINERFVALEWEGDTIRHNFY